MVYPRNKRVDGITTLVDNFKIDSQVKKFTNPMPKLEEMVPIMEENSLDDKFIQLTKDTKNKVDEVKEKVAKHIREDHHEDDIYKFLLQTKRGRLFCRLLGYKTARLRDKWIIKKTMKLKAKERKIRGL